MALKPVGDNTLVFSITGQEGETSITMNGQDATAFFMKRAKGLDKVKPAAMLFNRLSFFNEVTQFPYNKSDWFAVHAFKIEQLRPPLDDSSEAAIDLVVPGSDLVTVTIEVVDSMNDSKGYVLRDARVSPGKYRLYWDGIDQKGVTPGDSAWIGSGSYTFRLTTSKSEVHCIGDVNNSAPKYTTKSYETVNSLALAITPPGTTAQTAQPHKWSAINNANDTRKLDATDSVQSIGVAYDAAWGQWIASDGAVIHTRAGSTAMQDGRALAMTPPDPSDPTNPAKQFYFCSQNIRGGDAVVSSCFPVDRADTEPKAQSKVLTNPDWNRTKPGFVPYQIQLGQVPGGATLGPQRDLVFRTGSPPGEGPRGEWVFRNVRFYEEGSPDPGPMTFDPSLLTERRIIKGDRQPPPPSDAPLTTISETAPPASHTALPKAPKSVPQGTVTVEDNGHAIHLRDAPSVNYPLNYNDTPNTIMAFDLDVIDATGVGDNNGVGLTPEAVGATRDDDEHFFHFLGGKSSSNLKYGFKDPSIGAYSYPSYQPNTLYTDSIPLPPLGASKGRETGLFWQPGFYGLKVSENGKFLFACNNSDNRLEVRDISTDGSAVAKIPINYPMFVTLAPEGSECAPQGTRIVYVDSPKAGLLRIAWNLSDNTFGKPETITPASEFAYPRGVTYSAADGRIFVCDTFNMDHSKAANQIVVIDPKSGKVLSRFGKQGGVDPKTGGQIDDETFTCPLTIDADSKGAIWVNDYFSCEMRKYDFDPASNSFKIERRVLGCNYTNTSHFYWLPDAPPTQVWTGAGFFIRDDADIDADGRYTNERVTDTTTQLGLGERPYAHFSKVDGHIYVTLASKDKVFEQVGDGWVPRFAFGGNTIGKKGADDTTEGIARAAGLLSRPGEPPTDLDKAIAAAGDPDWKTRPWAWSDLNGDGKMEYTKDNPEFKIDFNSKFSIDGHFPCTCFRSSDGAYVFPSDRALHVIPPQMVDGKISYDWKNAKIIPCAEGPPIVDVLAQDGRFYVLRNPYRASFGKGSFLECYDEAGKLLWTREHANSSLQSLQSLGDGMFSIMDRSWSINGPVMIRDKDGDLINQVFCRDNGDCWSNGALRGDADTGYIGLIQVYKVTGLSTVKSAAATVNLPRAGF